MLEFIPKVTAGIENVLYDFSVARKADVLVKFCYEQDSGNRSSNGIEAAELIMGVYEIRIN